MEVCKTVKYSVRKVGLWSVFKFFLVYGILIGVIIGLITGFYLTTLPFPGKWIPGFPATPIPPKPIWAGLGILGGVVFGVFYGVTAAIFALIGAILYNLIAKLTGGIEVELE